MGFGFFTIFQSALNYLIDTFQKYAASAVAANTFLRSVFAASFPLFVDPMYHHLGIPWASSVFAFFAVLLIPIPYLFFFFGESLRKRGTFTANPRHCERIYVSRAMFRENRKSALTNPSSCPPARVLVLKKER